MQHYEMVRIKEALGLPPNATINQVEAKIAELRDLEERLKSKLPPEERPELPWEQETSLITELQQMEYEPLIPVEKRLILWSIGLGVLALVFLVWVSYTFFPGNP
jgi:hypothetical protein|uniref:Uncharacterized protein n=1 Tax=Desulfobacca acetoxidans TaxID=60893 RepID=A0A7C3UYS7_9BACT